MQDESTASSPPASISAVPSILDRDALFNSLRKAKLCFESSENGREGVAVALAAVIHFLERFRTIDIERLSAPLVVLGDALLSLEAGKVAPVLSPRKRRGAAPEGVLYETLKGSAVSVVRRLQATGMSCQDSRGAVARELSKLGLRPARKGSREGAGQFTARTIAKWEDDIAADIGFRTVAAVTFRAMEAQATAVKEALIQRDGHATYRKLYLTCLVRFAAEIRRQHRKST